MRNTQKHDFHGILLGLGAKCTGSNCTLTARGPSTFLLPSCSPGEHIRIFR